MKRLLLACLALVVTVSAALALPVVSQEPGSGKLNGPNDCVLVSGPSWKKDELCPKAKFMRVCGAKSSSEDRERTCVKSDKR